MEPIVSGECFGWLHRAEGPLGVVMCSPFGYDALCTHRGWRRLAEQFAARGISALRFDYPGTGDSLGIEEDPGRVEAWLDGIDTAIEVLRERTGVAQIALCGFRLGALLAARAAQRRGGVDALILFAPVVSGRQYVRELRVHRQTWLTTPAGFSAEPLPDDANHVEAYGFGIHGDDVKQIGAIDLTKTQGLPAKRVLLLDSVDRTRVSALANRYRELGGQADVLPFDDGDTFMLEALYSETPQASFDKAVEWLEQGIAGGAQITQPQLARETPTLHMPDGSATETPVFFDLPQQRGQYFGMHCVPARPDPALPAVLFCNTGASHHIGDGRMFVLFARRLAQQGIASLRMDLSGLGDSSPLAAEVTLDTIYSETSRDDAVAGAAWLERQGYKRVVVFGVCGGAFNGLHAALHHRALVGCVSVNLQKFIWDGEDRAPGTPVFAQSRLYWRSAFSARKWIEALQGRANPLRALRAVTQRGWRFARARASDLLLRLAPRGAAARDTNPMRALMHGLDAKGVQVRLVYGEFDVGLEELKIHFGTLGSALRRLPSIRVLLLPKLDHALFTGVAREAVMRDTEAWLTTAMREPAAQANPATVRTGSHVLNTAGAAHHVTSSTAPSHAHLPGVGS